MLARLRGLLSGEDPIEDHSEVCLYTDRDDLLPAYRPRRPLSAGAPARVTVSLVATAKDEEAGLPAWGRAIFAQSRLPDEIIIVSDSGSRDGTLAGLRALQAESPVPFHLIQDPVRAPGPIARGRNRGIARARGPIIAVTDFGCAARPDWLERLVRPFELDPGLQVSAGFYECLDADGRPTRQRLFTTLAQVDPRRFLPSSRSLAFTRAAFEAAGGYPEWLTLTGEDTWFALELKRLGGPWAFVPEAVVTWPAPGSTVEYWRKVAYWTTGDGEAGLRRRWYRSLALRLSAKAVLAGPLFVYHLAGGRAAAEDALRETGAEAAALWGFLRGWRRRGEVALRRQAS